MRVKCLAQEHNTISPARARPRIARSRVVVIVPSRLAIYNNLLLPYLRNIIPMREIVAGEAQLRSCDSNRKLTLGPNCILSPEGMVSSLLSSRTELRDSIHSGSMSPSQTIHDWTSIGSRTTWRAAFVKTPSDHSRVSMSICPSSY